MFAVETLNMPTQPFALCVCKSVLLWKFQISLPAISFLIYIKSSLPGTPLNVRFKGSVQTLCPSRGTGYLSSDKLFTYKSVWSRSEMSDMNTCDINTSEWRGPLSNSHGVWFLFSSLKMFWFIQCGSLVACWPTHSSWCVTAEHRSFSNQAIDVQLQVFFDIKWAELLCM